MYLLNYIKKNIERRRQEKKFKEELIKKLSQDPKVVKAGNDYLEAREKLLKRVKGELTEGELKEKKRHQNLIR